MPLDESYMRQALAMAREGALKGEVPVGAVLVHRGQVIAKAHNQVEVLQDATAHAEMLCLKKGAEVLGNWRLLKAVLYCTLEPCSMCAGAMIQSRIEKVVWGAAVRCGANGSWTDLLGPPHPIHQVVVASGVLKEECGELMKNFFKEQRQCKSCLMS